MIGKTIKSNDPGSIESWCRWFQGIKSRRPVPETGKYPDADAAIAENAAKLKAAREKARQELSRPPSREGG